MAAEWFVSGLAFFYTILFLWGFKTLPKEEWQILASVPREKRPDRSWRGINFTYYGFFTACAYGAGTAMVFILLGSVHIPIKATITISMLVGLICVPASRLIAAWVEKKPHTLTIGGALFAGVLLGPWLVDLNNRVLGPWLGFQTPVMAVLAGLSIGYSFGEGTGRLACISFGCCYGRPLAQCHPALRWVFKQFHFVFVGKTKKIAYAQGLEGVPVIPIQAVTSILYLFSALLGTYFFLQGQYAPAFLETMIWTQLWRFLSEFFRADYRGERSISAYQWMSLLGIGYMVFIPFYFGNAVGGRTDLVAGLVSLWNPAILIFLQLLWWAIFFFTGRSQVTGSIISIHVNEGQI